MRPGFTPIPEGDQLYGLREITFRNDVGQILVGIPLGVVYDPVVLTPTEQEYLIKPTGSFSENGPFDLRAIRVSADKIALIPQ